MRSHPVPMAPFRQACRSRIEEFAGLVEALNRWALGAGVPPRALRSVVLILDELFTNIVIHGYRGDPDGDILVEAQANADAITVTLTDHAFAFNPLLVPETDTTLSLEERAVGGLGLLFVRRTADALHYRRLAEGTPEAVNQLTYNKHLDSSTHAA